VETVAITFFVLTRKQHTKEDYQVFTFSNIGFLTGR